MAKDIYDVHTRFPYGAPHYATDPYHARTEGSHTHLKRECGMMGVKTPQKGTKDYAFATLITQTFTRVQSHFTLRHGTPYIVHPHIPNLSCFATLEDKS